MCCRTSHSQPHLFLSLSLSSSLLRSPPCAWVRCCCWIEGRFSLTDPTFTATYIYILAVPGHNGHFGGGWRSCATQEERFRTCFHPQGPRQRTVSSPLQYPVRFLKSITFLCLFLSWFLSFFLFLPFFFLLSLPAYLPALDRHPLQYPRKENSHSRSLRVHTKATLTRVMNRAFLGGPQNIHATKKTDDGIMGIGGGFICIHATRRKKIGWTFSIKLFLLHDSTLFTMPPSIEFPARPVLAMEVLE